MKTKQRRTKTRELPAGWTVSFEHSTSLTTPNGRGVAGKPRRATRAVIYDAHERYVSDGLAMCNPNDQFNKRIGRDVALGRALKGMTD